MKCSTRRKSKLKSKLSKKKTYGVKDWFEKNWDWFESAKWLSIATGIFFTLEVIGLILIIKFWYLLTNQSRIGAVLMFIGVSGMGILTADMTKAIRRNNTPKECIFCSK